VQELNPLVNTVAREHQGLERRPLSRCEDLIDKFGRSEVERNTHEVDMHWSIQSEGSRNVHKIVAGQREKIRSK